MLKDVETFNSPTGKNNRIPMELKRIKMFLLLALAVGIE